MRWLLLLLCGPAGWAGSVPLGEHLPALGDLNKPVQSILERRYANIERQHTDFSCGAAAVATINAFVHAASQPQAAFINALQPFDLLTKENL